MIMYNQTMPNKKSFSILLVFSLALCACGGTLADAPSLNKRAFEITLEEMRAQANEGITIDSALASDNMDRNTIGLSVGDDAKIIWQAHQKADADFISQSSEAQSVVRKARGASFGSDNWSIAQVEISRLDRARAPSLKSLGELDKIIFARLENKASNENIADENIDRLLQLQKFVQSDVETQSRFLDTLSDSLANR